MAGPEQEKARKEAEAREKEEHKEKTIKKLREMAAAARLKEEAELKELEAYLDSGVRSGVMTKDQAGAARDFFVNSAFSERQAILETVRKVQKTAESAAPKKAAEEQKVGGLTVEKVLRPMSAEESVEASEQIWHNLPAETKVQLVKAAFGEEIRAEDITAFNKRVKQRFMWDMSGLLQKGRLKDAKAFKAAIKEFVEKLVKERKSSA